MTNKLNIPSTVTFPLGSLRENSRVIYAEHREICGVKNLIIITDVTPFHPLDYIWPDQPGDKGFITIEGSTIPVLTSLTGAFHPSYNLFIDKDIKVKRNETGWYYHVVHILSNIPDISPEALYGKSVTLDVDIEFRHSLNRVHTACHLMALAINKVTGHLWSKETKRDSLGNPNLDQSALQQSSIFEDQSIDHYRLGKSLRKSGFNVESFFGDIDEIVENTQTQLNQWILDGFSANIVTDSVSLNSIRYWEANLSDGNVIIPCGGTHVKSSNEIGKPLVRIVRDNDESELSIYTSII